jgi:hypothetical protein
VEETGDALIDLERKEAMRQRQAIRGWLGSVQKPEATCGIYFAGPVAGPVTGETVALTIWSKERRELGVEDGLEFFRLQAVRVAH